ncbi:hypothetical protein B9Z55_005337 [Caenorhabditis nigoni]|uniref:Uncharacterized protein n=1 Tax=Caenorhabditis nigoni TaxID=1611254 RepID=A0A2G5V0G4_9PELO|nr:hypothetical protein B9Z55_005337 [Caenorhabditis nigoni]
MCVGLINAQSHYVAPRNGRPGGPMGQILDDIDAERANVEHLRQRSIREIKRAIRQREDLENDRLEETMTFAAVAASHPITVARALMQFGFEPFEKAVGSKYYFFGPPTLFFPNLFSYMKQLYTTRGFLTLLTGLDSAICIRFFSSIIDSAVWNAMDNFVGEVNTDLRKKQSLENSVRIAVKLVVTDCVVKTITRPFKVVMLRQIACIIENRAVFSTLQGIEYGWKAGWTDLYT